MVSTQENNQQLINSQPFVSPYLEKKRCIKQIQFDAQKNLLNQYKPIRSESLQVFNESLNSSQNQYEGSLIDVPQQIGVRDFKEISQTQSFILLSQIELEKSQNLKIQKGFAENKLSVLNQVMDENQDEEEDSNLKKQRSRSLGKIIIKPQRNFFGYKNENRLKKQQQ